MLAQEIPSPTASIGDVARETGLSKDTLRVWERRYGFPTPIRNLNDERVYPDEQVERLRIIRRLLDSGLRPGKIVGLTLDELTSIGGVRPARRVEAATCQRPGQLLELLVSHREDELRQRLSQLLMQLGLRQFILEILVPLNSLVGNAWLAGSLEIFEEHLYTQQIQGMLQHALGAIAPSTQRPRVLLTTLPREEHHLGLLMAHAFLAMEGAQCVSLGTQTPPTDILKAVAAHAVDIVGLSCTAANPPRVTSAQLSGLRGSLARSVELWVGGTLALPDRHTVIGVRYVAALPDLPGMLAQWRAGPLAQ